MMGRVAARLAAAGGALVDVNGARHRAAPHANLLRHRVIVDATAIGILRKVVRLAELRAEHRHIDSTGKTEAHAAQQCARKPALPAIYINDGLLTKSKSPE
jgi:hypothetical protein